jgi:hypothetical protein
MSWPCHLDSIKAPGQSLRTLHLLVCEMVGMAVAVAVEVVVVVVAVAVVAGVLWAVPCSPASARQSLAAHAAGTCPRTHCWFVDTGFACALAIAISSPTPRPVDANERAASACPMRPCTSMPVVFPFAPSSRTLLWCDRPQGAQLHVNSCLDQGGVGAAGGGCDLGDVVDPLGPSPDACCPVCRKDLGPWTLDVRMQHINRCGAHYSTCP